MSNNIDKKKFYNTKEWKRCRIDALIKYPFCYRCKTQPSIHIDHTIPFIDINDPHASNPDNHVGLCHECHSAVTTMDEHKYIKMYDDGCDYEEIRDIKYKYRRIGKDGYPI